MSSPRMRPTFSEPLPVAPDVMLAALEAELARTDARCIGYVLRDGADLRVGKAEAHLWSPTLNVKVRDDEDGRRVMGRFAPHPNVWTTFMAIYGVLVMGGIFGSMYGIAQWMLGRSPWALMAAPVAAALFGFVYGAAFIGQGLGAEQMYVLRAVVDAALERARGDGPREPIV